MKQNVSPVVFISIIAVVVVVAGFFLWKSSKGVNSGSGRLQSDLNTSAVSNSIKNDPDKFSKEVQDSFNKNKTSTGQ